MLSRESLRRSAAVNARTSLSEGDVGGGGVGAGLWALCGGGVARGGGSGGVGGSGAASARDGFGDSIEERGLAASTPPAPVIASWGGGLRAPAGSRAGDRVGRGGAAGGSRVGAGDRAGGGTGGVGGSDARSSISSEATLRSGGSDDAVDTSDIRLMRRVLGIAHPET